MMIMSTQLYVADVEKNADFFKKIGFAEISRQNIAGKEMITLAPEAAGNARLQLWNIDVIKKMSPEVADNVPSLLFEVSDITTWHERVAAGTSTTSRISRMGKRQVFNFAIPNGNYFSFAQND